MPLKNGMISTFRIIHNQYWREALDAYPSSEAFDLIHSSLQSDEAGRKDAIKKGNAIYAFTLKNKEGQTLSWHIDLKEKGEVAQGEAPSGKQADGGSFKVYRSSVPWGSGCPILYHSLS